MRLLVWAWIIGLIVVVELFTYKSTVSSLRPAGFAVPVTLYICVSTTLVYVFLIFSLSAPYAPRRRLHLAAGVLFASSFGVLVAGIAWVHFHVPVPAAVAVAVCAAAGGGTFSVIRSSRSAKRSLAWSLRRPADRRFAQDLRTDTRYAAASRRTSEDQDKLARLNDAGGAIWQSRSDDAPDGLVAAVELLSSLLDDPPDDWLELFVVATDLVDANSVRAAKHGDFGGYPKALEILAAVAGRMPADFGAMAVVYDRRADYHVALAHRLPAGPEFEAHAAEAVANQRAAIGAVAPPLRSLLPDMHARLGFLVARTRAHPGDLAAGIEMCRTGIRLAGPRLRARAHPGQTLALLLIDLALEGVDELPVDASQAEWEAAGRMAHRALAEAERLLRYARRYGGRDSRADVVELQAQARTARALISDGPGTHYRAARAWRAAARAAGYSDPLDRVRIGLDWVGWAETTGEVTWCAEAYGYLMSVVPPAVAVRYLADERDRVLVDVQATAEEAGFWLAEAGRIGEAAIALEQGRAVSLTEVLGREQPALVATLARIGRDDLAARYRAAIAEYGAAVASATGDGLRSARQRAWAEFDAVVRDIKAAAGVSAAVLDAGLPGAPPTLDELIMAARDGPLVYLAASARGGYAIIVPPDGAPVYRPLPGLAKPDVADQAGRFLPEPGRAQVEAVVRWLWDGGIRALARDLPAGSLVTIVPVGLLGLLPVHAAGGPTAPMQEPADWDYLADRVTVRYAPNARTLLRARDRAAELAQQELALLAVAAPDGGTQQRLDYAVSEVTRIAGQWAHADAITDGSPERVWQQLAGHAVWHFACHCEVTPDRILDSALLLDGARLGLRAILALPSSSRRLAVLSACETHLSGTHLPDEAVGLPSGLLQAGFAGVVACHWPVLDKATAYLMIRFHELWHGQGLPPAAALAEAQRWLRTATTAELAHHLDRAGDGRGATLTAAPSARTAGLFGHPYFWAAFALTGH